MTILWLDLETYSECDLKAHSTHRYAEHPSTQIIVAQWALDDGEPVVLDMTCPYPGRWRVEQYLLDPGTTIVAHNSHFDRTILRHCWGIDAPIERWQDTMVKALAHGLPGALGKAGEALGVPADLAKDKRGRQLIQMFCKPVRGQRRTRDTHPREWAEFLEYSRQDIVAMREIDRRLPSWNYRTGHLELALWHLDQRINDRGVAVDLDLAAAAAAAAEREQARLGEEMAAATHGAVSSAGQRDELLRHIAESYGVDLPDLRADTVRRRLEDGDLPDPLRLLLSLRLEATKTSTAKYAALTRAVSADGRLRNTLQFAGAPRTGRWAGRVFQPQNMPRPTMDTDQIETGIAALKAGAADLVVDDVMALASNAVRGCIIAPPGRKLCVADLSNIEGRVLAWVAGEGWKLRAFHAFDAGLGPDLYNVAYGRSFDVDPASITKAQRQIGKVMELALGYEGGVAAFLTFAAVYRMDLDALARAVAATAAPEALDDARRVWAWAVERKRTAGLSEPVYVACEVLKRAWREAHPATVALWRDLAEAVRGAIRTPGVRHEVRMLAVQRDGAWLRIRLPSGRVLCYPSPQLDEHDGISYMGVDQWTRQWTRIKTYGGKLVENVVQAAARDVLAHGMEIVERNGYDIVLSVHDELITEVPDNAAFSWLGLVGMMSIMPAWARGLPLAAAGFETKRYRKE